MMGTQEMPNLVFPNGRKSPRFSGVHFWTPAQREAYTKLENRARAVRAALRGAYATN